MIRMDTKLNERQQVEFKDDEPVNITLSKTLKFTVVD
jgi:hypothetical protein